MADSSDHLRHVLRSSVSVIADNVADYRREITKAKETWSTDDIPCTMPPFDNMFIEWDVRMLGGGKAGFVIFSREVKPGDIDTLDEYFRLSKCEANLEHTKRDAKYYAVILGWMAIGRIHGGMPIPLNETSMFLNQTGSIIAMFGSKAGIDDEFVFDMMHVPLLTLAFMNCKNVNRIDVSHAENPKPKVARRNRLPETKFYTLAIGPMVDVLRSEGRSEATGITKAMHICRGHFAHYTPDKPLFGRYVGTFWRPMHVRGNEAVGKIVKDYEVKTPSITAGE